MRASYSNMFALSMEPLASFDAAAVNPASDSCSRRQVVTAHSVGSLDQAASLDLHTCILGCREPPEE